MRQTAGLVDGHQNRWLFDIGSAAKSITAVAVLLLRQEGQLDLAASISRYLPRVPAADRPGQLGHHRSRRHDVNGG